MPRVETHTLILNDLGGAKSTASPYDVEYNLSNFFTQFPKRGNNATYRLGLKYLHFDSAIGGVDTLNVRVVGFSQNKNRIYFANNYTSDIIATVGAHIGGTSFNYDAEQVHLVEGFFASQSLVRINFVDYAGAPIDWAPTTNHFQMVLIVEILYDE